MPANDMMKITDNLLKVYNYAFVEEMPYGFYKPNAAMYAGVRLEKSQYNCPKCKQSFQVNIRNDNDGIIYFSKSRIAQQKEVYQKLDLDFPEDWELMEKPFTYQHIGYCAKCAQEDFLNAAEGGQRINNLCHQLYLQDMLVADKAKKYTTDAVQKWLDTITESSDLTKYDLSNPEIMQELIWIMVLSDTEKVQEALQEYRDNIQPILYEINKLLEKATPAWKAYVARSTSLQESMSDGEYHEYTLAFPADNTKGQDVYYRREVEKSRVEMFISQRRIASIEELLTDVGFQEQWIDMVVAKGTSLKK